MADPNVQSDKSTGDDKKGRELTIVLPGPDGTFEAVAHLEHNEDVAQPPRLVKISKHLLDSSTPTSDDRERETHIIISTASGHRTASHFFKECVDPILATLYPSTHETFTIHTTQSASSVLELTNTVLFPKADEGKPLRVILLSGDGGIIDVVNGLSSRPTSTAYIPPQVILLPLGTANALYHSINVGKENTWGLNALASTASHPLPIFTATFSPGARLLVDEARSAEPLATNSLGHGVLHGAVVCSWGMHASLVADSDTTEYRKFGLDRFKMAAKDALYPADGSLPHAYKARVSVLKNNAWLPLQEKEHLYTLATLVSNLEQPFCISPASKPLDGSMHLVYFGPTSGDDAMRIMGLAYQGGKHVSDPAVRYEAIDGLRIEFQGGETEGRWRRICIDGKIVRVEGDGWVEVRKEERRVVDVVVVDGTA
ncbi:hypothetical protein P153DRAFT_363671 [Dothidotthia symphoricarpi CBS 119687]|uniref:DAGKc domain-containing protein n=1 Tax=Dothidotthia symphoricarpi CBS 119687 TaxID=1392245 RepID=A0A6A6AQP3_9PLEO|nr:uncharacterized protein P153DRAFT_363671 [Dothidotthia symphoricarpi CBS 119687]KAF2133488.1 hypothetical protein P153DRAFT_363671 [Dothidotthia symphoricarpi CBS 119687]